MEATMAEPAYPLTLPDDDGQTWPAQGKWTYEDYLRLPDDGRRYEVIRGHLFVTASPSFDHQYVVMQLGRRLADFVFGNHLGVVLISPFDILLPDGIATPVEPDILFIRAENQPRSGDKNYRGVPDLFVEVLSPWTRRVDKRIKLLAYQDAGVPEYWLVDPQSRTVVIYRLDVANRRYVEIERAGMEEEVGSEVLAGFRVRVGDLFPRDL